MVFITKDELVQRLQIKPDDIVNRFVCTYSKVYTDEFGEIDVCDIHTEISLYPMEFGPRRPCNNAQIEDKLPLTITQFLRDRARESEKKAHNSVLEEDHTKIAAIIHTILNWHDSWPVLVQGPREFVEDLYPETGVEGMVFRMTQQMEWLTTKAYIEKFSSEPPTAPLLHQLAMMWDDHPDFREEWRI